MDPAQGSRNTWLLCRHPPQDSETPAKDCRGAVPGPDQSVGKLCVSRHGDKGGPPECAVACRAQRTVTRPVSRDPHNSPVMWAKGCSQPLVEMKRLSLRHRGRESSRSHRKVRWEGPAKPRVPRLLAQWSAREATHRTSRSTGTSASQETGLAALSPAPSQAKRTMQKLPHARRTATPTPSADTAQPPPQTTRASALPAAGGPGRGDFTQHDSQTPARPTSAASTLPCSEHLPCSALIKATVCPGLDFYARKFRPLFTYGLELFTWLLTFTRMPVTQPAWLSGRSLSLLPLGGLTTATDLSGSHPSCPRGSRCIMGPKPGKHLSPSVPAC